MREVQLTPQLRATCFTLIELLVVIAIIAILSALLLPVLQQGKEQAYTVVCLANQKQCGIAFFCYSTDFNQYTIGASTWRGAPWASDNIRWYQFFQGSDPLCQNYIAANKRDVLFCPKNASAPSGPGSYGVYGAWGWRATLWEYQDSEYMTGNLDAYSCYYMTWKIKQPAKYILLGCTSSAGIGSQEFHTGSNYFSAYMFLTGGSSDQQGLWMSHGGVNGLFFDGHAQICKDGDLLSTHNYRKVNDPNFAGGLRYWKTKKGIAVTN